MIRTKLVAAALGVLIAGTAVAPSFADTTPKPAVSGASATTTQKTHVRHHRRHRAAPAASTRQSSTPSTSSQKK